MGSRARIAAVGEICEDVFLDAEGVTKAQTLGGISCNFARSAAWAGGESALFAALGEDQRGERVLNWLAEERVVTFVRKLNGITPCQKVRIETNGERRFVGFDPGVLFDYELSDEELRAINSYEVVALPCSPESHRVFDQILTKKRSGASYAMVADFSPESLEGDGALLARYDEVASDLAIAFVGGDSSYIEPLRERSRQVETVTVLTLGALGAIAFHRGNTWREAAVSTKVVDTTGCGDAFAGAFVARYFEAYEPESDLPLRIQNALKQAAMCAALVASKLGGGPGFRGNLL
ncbi:MAG: carbohydrate kinase family protein [Polyangiaceae bacterium]|nr:carbohydrate kinase family protein [Polyangiaceae bacterium]